MNTIDFSQIDHTFLKGITASPSNEPELFCRQATFATARLPFDIVLRLIEFASHGSSTGFLLFQNIHVDNTTPQTPPGNTYFLGEKTMLSKIQGILISVIGNMIAYEAEGYGRLFQDVVPMQNMAKNQTSLGSDIELEIHTEQAFSKLRPDILSLACLRGDENAYTYILPVKSVIDNLTPFEIQMLREPLWITGVDLSFKLHGNPFLEGDIRGPMPILHGSIEDPEFIFDQIHHNKKTYDICLDRFYLNILCGRFGRRVHICQTICKFYQFRMIGLANISEVLIYVFHNRVDFIEKGGFVFTRF